MATHPATTLLDSAASRSDGTKVFFRARFLKEKSSIISICTTPVDSCCISPKTYFSASNELVCMLLIVCWAITLIVDPDQVANHPARKYIGHYNPCFGWDFPPASYVAVLGCAADVHLAWTAATLEATRTKLLCVDGKAVAAERFALVTAWGHGVASMLWMLLWQVGPNDGRWSAHLGIFSTAICLRYLSSLGNYVEARFGRPTSSGAGRVETKHTVFIIVYGIVTFMLPVLYFYDIIVYRAEGRVGVDPPLPWWLLHAFDMAWMICIILNTYLRVPEPPMRIVRKVLAFDEPFEADEAEREVLVAEGQKQV